MNNRIQHNIEDFVFEEELDTADFDRLYTPKSMNSRNTMTPVHVYRILLAQTTPEVHIKQTDLQKILSEKYEINIDRKSLSRYIHTLEDEGLGIRSSKSQGVWYDSNFEWAEYFPEY